jgi:ATP synthase protein I
VTTLASPRFKGKTTDKQRQQIIVLFISQIALTFLISALLWLWKGSSHAYSGLLGGLAYLLPNLYQMKEMLLLRRSDNLRKTLISLYRSEIWKIALTMLLFAMIFSLVRPIEPFSLFGVFILMQVTAWVAPLIQNQQLLR